MKKVGHNIMDNIDHQVRVIIERIYKKKHADPIMLNLSTSLRNDLGFDSLDLAELTVKIEDIFDVDIFENRIVDTLQEIEKEIENARN